MVVLAHSFWETEFASDPSIIGRRIRLNGLEFTVIGVAPESFTGMDLFSRPAFYVPAMMSPAMLTSNRDLLTNRGIRAFSVKGRLKPGVSLQAGSTEAAALAKSLEIPTQPPTARSERRYAPNCRRGWTTTRLTPLMMAMLFAIVVVALLIACANVANLILSRGRARAREIAVRLAIGASRGRLIRQLMAESLVIALLGAALGLVVAQIGIDVISHLPQAGDIPSQTIVELNTRVLCLRCWLR